MEFLTKLTYISIDIEAALIRGKQYCIEIGAVKYEPNGAIDTFSQLIQPYKFKRLNRHITALTGITSEQLYDAPSFKDVMRDFKAWCGEKAIFLTFGEFDRKVLEDECTRNRLSTKFLFPMVDYQQKLMIHSKVKEQPSLARMMEQLGLEAEVAHRALADADSLRQIFMSTNGEKIIQSQQTDKLTMVISSLKPNEHHYDLMVGSLSCKVTKKRVEIEEQSFLFEKLDFEEIQKERVDENGEKIVTTTTKIIPSAKVKSELQRIVAKMQHEVVLTRNGMRGFTKILKLHGVQMPKTEVMSWQFLMQSEEASNVFLYNDESPAIYEAKVISLLKKNERYIIDEFEKRALFPNVVQVRSF